MDTPPSMPALIIFDAVTDQTEVGLIGSLRGSGGLDVSAGLAIEATSGSVSDIDGTSTQLEGGAGPVAVSVSAFDGEHGSGVPSSSSPTGSIAVEFGPSGLPIGGNASREITGTFTLKKNERKDFD